MPPTEKPDTHQKALALNLDPSKFGSFAEIGAGQEVARWFLAVGAASGTVRLVMRKSSRIRGVIFSSSSMQ